MVLSWNAEEKQAVMAMGRGDSLWKLQVEVVGKNFSAKEIRKWH